MLGVSKNSVMLCPYSEEWHLLFEKEKTNLYNCTERCLIDIQHVGSTSIIGMPAKPIIDIVIAVKDLNEGFELVSDVEAIGYNFKGSLGKSKRFFFWKEEEGINTHNLHIVEHGDKNWQNLILFRDFMNKHEDYRNKYINLKEELASKYKDDRGKYTEKKAESILGVIQLAKGGMHKY